MSTQTWYPQDVEPQYVPTYSPRVFEVWSQNRLIDMTRDPAVAASYQATGYIVVEY